MTPAHHPIKIIPIIHRLLAGRGLPWSGLMLVAALFLNGGCRGMNKPASASFASVEIKHKTVDQIQEACVAVFKEDGYSVASSAPNNMIFEREGSRMNQLAYGGLIEDRGVWVRAVAEIVSLSADTHRLQCKAYIVRHYGDSFFEEQTRLSNLRRGPYQRLLRQVVKRLR